MGVMSISLFGLSQTWPLAMRPLTCDCETEFLILFSTFVSKSQYRRQVSIAPGSPSELWVPSSKCKWNLGSALTPFSVMLGPDCQFQVLVQ